MKIFITGAAGLVGLNLILLLNELGYDDIIAMDKDARRMGILKKNSPKTKRIIDDVINIEKYRSSVFESTVFIQLHARISGLKYNSFVHDNIKTTEVVCKLLSGSPVEHLIHVSSSVYHSKVEDFYSRSKIDQEKLVVRSALPYTVLRPTLMFGWFDPKHLGWLARFLTSRPVFPIPGNGKFLRQPLYVRDFCRCIISVMEQGPQNTCFDIVGDETIDYKEMILIIKRHLLSKSLLLSIPVFAFSMLLKIYAMFCSNPPFTQQQLKSLIAGDHFIGVDMEKTFNVLPTCYKTAIAETFNHPEFSPLVYLLDE